MQLPETITCGHAHQLLGGAPEYTPPRPGKPATSRQLWTLNMQGRMLVLEAGETPEGAAKRAGELAAARTGIPY